MFHCSPQLCRGNPARQAVLTLPLRVCQYEQHRCRRTLRCGRGLPLVCAAPNAMRHSTSQLPCCRRYACACARAVPHRCSLWRCVVQYDDSCATYSPDGRVFQVEYAQKAIEQSGYVEVVAWAQHRIRTATGAPPLTRMCAWAAWAYQHVCGRAVQGRHRARCGEAADVQDAGRHIQPEDLPRRRSHWRGTSHHTPRLRLSDPHTSDHHAHAG